MTVAGRTSPYTLYHPDMATFEADNLFEQKDAQGFINLYGLPLKIRGILSPTWTLPAEEVETS
jgi:argininosuccinate synthase